ncbi:ankyrin repeat-containing domain protein [Lasiosphaeris hirsuta]|uniref:Ankyrin repeat-containing domain protein n=1 Tax=Lasiosphaeris hirsuta TaxID=260670 RepID=A0AA40AGJ8_9PEZI|nr:ankyrin repeat-containing domain protein [Lasiosphaeris hirsuta]
MEPLSILGAVTACSEIVTVIARVTTNLYSLKQRWSEGARSLQLLIAKLSTVRAALTQVKDWAELNASTSPNGEEMRDSLGVAMEGCQVFIEALDQDVAGLLGDSRFCVPTQADRQFHSQSLSEQNSLLRQTAARHVFQQIREDTSTVREQSTVRDAERSTIAGTEVAPAPPRRRLDRIDSFPESSPDNTSSFGFNVRPPNSTWQRPMPFEMLPYGPSPPPMSPASDKSSNTSGFFSFGKVVSSNTSISAESLSNRLRLSSSGSRPTKEDATMSPKSQLSMRFPGELAATDMYLQSDGNHPPPKPIVAAQRGDHAEMASLIQTGRTPLAVACHCGHNDVVELLIAEGAKIDSKDKRNLSPLHLAAANGHCHVMATLLDRDTDINARGPHGKTPLRIACDHGQLDAVRLLAKRRAMIDCPSVVGDNDIARLLLQFGANKDAKDSHMRTPLHSACISGRADLEAQEEENLTPLAAAARAGLTAVMDAGDFTPLHWASYNSHEEAVGLLIANKKTELDARSINGRSPLHLVSSGASLEAECRERNRPLHYGCQYATHTSCNVQNMTGETPLHIAVRTGSLRMVKALVARGAHVDTLDNKAIRPLAIAGARIKGATDAPALLQHGGAVREVDAQGWDPLRRAAFAARATDLGTLSSFSFASTATVEQRKRILDLLTMAIDTENAEYQRVTYLASSAMPLNVGRENVTELPDTRSSVDQEPPPSPILESADEEPDSDPQKYYFERETTRPAPYFQPVPQPPVDLRNQQQQVPTMQRFRPYRPPSPSPSQDLTPSYLSPYVPAPVSSPETQYYSGYTPPSNFPGPVPPPETMLSPPSTMMISPPTSGRISPPLSTNMSTYTSSAVSAMSGTTPGYYPYPRPVLGGHGAPVARLEALYPVRTGTDANRAELP